MSVRDKWNKIYAGREAPGHVAAVLVDHADLLPESGRALDIACGLGANAFFLADQGLIVDAWDISDVAIAKLEANKGNRAINPLAFDITQASFGKCQYDVIVNTHFLDRSLIGAIKDALLPGGLVFFQTFTREKTVNAGPSNPDFLLDPGELEMLFDGLTVLAHRDHGASIRDDDPLAGQAYLVARSDVQPAR